MRSLSERLNDFYSLFGDGEVPHLYFAPGRVNLIGEHLDYNGGHVFPAAISLGIGALVRFHDRPQVRMASQGYDGIFALSLRDEILFDPLRHWANYPAGVLVEIMINGATIPGADILFDSSLPAGSGLSSSAALEVLTAVIFHEGNITDEHRVEIARLCQRAENSFIGVQSGIMDQFAVALGRKHHGMLLDTATLEYRHVPVDTQDATLVIMNSNKPRELVSSAYNERRDECGRALEEIRKIRPLQQLAEGRVEDSNIIEDETLRRRARHVITEEARTIAAESALSKGNMEEFGAMLTESHLSLRDDYEVSGPELDSLVHHALEADGCLGARMTGAGFGGCAIALVKTSTLDRFTSTVAAGYEKDTSLRADFYNVSISDGASEVTGEG